MLALLIIVLSYGGFALTVVLQGPFWLEAVFLLVFGASFVFDASDFEPTPLNPPY